MKILLDECLPRRLKSLFGNHEVKTVPEAGWAGAKNGALLGLAEKQFDVFITIDQNLQYQQNLKGRSIAIVLLVAPSSNYEVLAKLIPDILTVLPSIKSGQITQVSAT